MMVRVLAALVNLNHPGHYVHWGFIQISVANLVVIALMVLTFVLALVLPFHHLRPTGRSTVSSSMSEAAEEPTPEVTEP